MAKGPGGRPSKYKPEYCDLVMKYGKEGKFMEEFAGDIGVHTDTVLEWTKVHDEFSVAYKRARMAQLRHFQQLGYGLATGQVKGQVAAWCFMMKNMFGWRDSQHLEHTGKDGESLAPTKIILKMPDNGRRKKD